MNRKKLRKLIIKKQNATGMNKYDARKAVEKEMEND